MSEAVIAKLREHQAWRQAAEKLRTLATLHRVNGPREQFDAYDNLAKIAQQMADEVRPQGEPIILTKGERPMLAESVVHERDPGRDQTISAETAE